MPLRFQEMEVGARCIASRYRLHISGAIGAETGMIGAIPADVAAATEFTQTKGTQAGAVVSGGACVVNPYQIFPN